MDDFRLRVFITAAKTLNFTKCAEQLFISQPAVSKHIGELESRYKVQLFERSGSRLALTEAGRVMLEHAERIADGYRRLQYEMDLFTDRLGGELKVGASTTIAQYVLPQVLARFTARFPEVKVSLASGNSEQVEAALARHDTDLGLVESSARHHRHRGLYDPAGVFVLLARRTQRCLGRTFRGVRPPYGLILRGASAIFCRPFSAVGSPPDPFGYSRMRWPVIGNHWSFIRGLCL